MKQSPYIVNFLNGRKDTFYSFSVMGAFCVATSYMSIKAKDYRIKSIEDEFGNLYTDFALQYKTTEK